MLFYSISVAVTEFTDKEKYESDRYNRREKSPYKKKIIKTLNDINENTADSGTKYCVKSLYDDSINFAAYSEERLVSNKDIELFLDKMNIKYSEIVTDEISSHDFDKCVDFSRSENFIENQDDILSGIPMGGSLYITDSIERKIKPATKKDINQKAKDTYCISLKDEIERIYKTKKDKFYGHPVHYSLAFEKDSPIIDTSIEALLQALYKSNRIKSQRYSVMDLDDFFSVRDFFGENVFKLNKGCTIVISVEDDLSDGKYATKCRKNLQTICKIVQQYSSEVLTIFVTDKADKEIRDFLNSNLLGLAVVEIDENHITHKSARKYLEKKAKNIEIEPDENLFVCIKDKEKTYTVKEVDINFNDWYTKKLRTDIYSEYASVETNKEAIIEEKPNSRGFAYDELMNMIGLEKAKSVINDSLNFFKAQKLFKEKGISTQSNSMHMVFTGNPGTAKTSVARLFAEILKDNEILSNGILHEVGRADLVGEYVGHTAPKVKDAFKRAKGGVLFIDEAYSLLDDRKGMYGDEAINTIVQEMENNRDNIVVIFAGYSEEMETFLKRNPGLSSRIAFHVDFDDYSTTELVDITKLIAEKQGYEISSESDNVLSSIYDAAVKNKDFGNGRYARNIVEKARMKQATRLLGMDYEKVSSTDIKTLLPEDFDIPINKKEQVETHRTIGFSA